MTSYTLTASVRDTVTGETGTGSAAFTVNAVPAPVPSSGIPNPPLLGIYTTDEDNTGTYPAAWPNGQTPNIANTYQAWSQPWPTAFTAAAIAAGVTAFVELEPWHMGTNWNQTPSFPDIISGVYDSWLQGIGSAIAAGSKPEILTFAHEFNVSGQYPWAYGDTGSNGTSQVSPTMWISAWNHVRQVVNGTAKGLAIWMWVPNAYTGGSTIDPTPYWPGAANVDMIGVDGYPTTQYGASLGTFNGYFGPTFTAIRKFSSLPIFLSETNLPQMVSSGGESITDFVRDMFAAGASGILEFDDANWGLASMTAAQWTEYNTAVATYGPK